VELGVSHALAILALSAKEITILRGQQDEPLIAKRKNPMGECYQFRAHLLLLKLRAPQLEGAPYLRGIAEIGQSP
jgi:hypothetical protein